jgi:small-conductance mechanosensitive channel
MNKQQHLIIGILSFLVYAYFDYALIKISYDIILFGLIAVVLGSIIPDILEAPQNWMHRGLGHSKRALKFTGKIFGITTILGLFSMIVPYFFIFFIISSFILGYGVHLLADATTEVGLPD